MNVENLVIPNKVDFFSEGTNYGYCIFKNEWILPIKGEFDFDFVNKYVFVPSSVWDGNGCLINNLSIMTTKKEKKLHCGVLLKTKKPCILKLSEYRCSFSSDNKFNCMLSEEKKKTWMFSDKSALKRDDELSDMYFLQTNDHINYLISFNENLVDTEKVFLLQDLLNTEKLKKILNYYSFSNILNALNMLIEEEILDDFPDTIKNEFSYVFDFINMVNSKK